MKYFLGIDNGGTVSKAVLFDQKGMAVASASEQVPMITPKPGFTERDMEVLWQANIKAIKSAVEKSGVNARDIKGVSCTGHGKGIYLWGKDNKPAYNGIVSTDSRAWKIADDWKKSGIDEKIYDRTCQALLACQPVSLIKWFMENDPEVLENTKWIFEVKDYIRFRLTGEAFAEITDYSGSNLMNIVDVKFDKTIYEDLGIIDVTNKLPPLKRSDEQCGVISEETAKATGLIAGTAVAGGMFDIDACAIAMNVISPEKLCVIAGTWSINEYVSRTPVTDKTIMMNSLFCMPGYYLIEECSPTSASNSEWYIQHFMEKEKEDCKARGETVYDLADRMVGGVAPEDQSIVFMPFIYGSNERDIAKASFVGINSYHTKAHILRAVYEGIIFSHKTHINKLLINNKGVEVIRFAGGAAKSRVWPQMFADVLQIPIEIIDTEELGALGCAMAAAVAAGEYRDFAHAAEDMVAVKQRLEPNPSLKHIYEKKFADYCAVVDALDSVWERLM